MDVWSSQGSVGSLMGMTMELWLDPVCHEGDWDGTRPWGCAHDRRAGTPTRRMTALSCRKRRQIVVFLAVDGRCLMMSRVAKSPHCTQRRRTAAGPSPSNQGVQRRRKSRRIACLPPSEPPPTRPRLSPEPKRARSP